MEKFLLFTAKSHSNKRHEACAHIPSAHTKRLVHPNWPHAQPESPCTLKSSVYPSSHFTKIASHPNRLRILKEFMYPNPPKTSLHIHFECTQTCALHKDFYCTQTPCLPKKSLHTPAYPNLRFTKPLVHPKISLCT